MRRGYQRMPALPFGRKTLKFPMECQALPGLAGAVEVRSERVVALDECSVVQAGDVHVFNATLWARRNRGWTTAPDSESRFWC